MAGGDLLVWARLRSWTLLPHEMHEIDLCLAQAHRRADQGFSGCRLASTDGLDRQVVLALRP